MEISRRGCRGGGHAAPAYLSVVGHNDQLHILGCRLDVALVLRGEGVKQEGEERVGRKK